MHSSFQYMNFFHIFVLYDFFRMAENKGLNYFSEANVLERFKRPPSYFEKISTVAFKPVSWQFELKNL